MKRLTILVVVLFVASCSTNKMAIEVQKSGFSVTPIYCYGSDCFSVTRATRIQLWNDSLPNGDYYSKLKMTLIGDGKREVKTEFVNKHVEGDIVTIDTEDYFEKFNQKTRKTLEYIDKTGKGSKGLSGDLFRQMRGPMYSSSGEIINHDIKIPVQSKTLIFKMTMFVHGLTEYNGKNYPLLEVRGDGNISVKGKKVVFSASGYALQDGTMRKVVKGVMDFTIRHGSTVKNFKIVFEEM